MKTKFCSCCCPEEASSFSSNENTSRTFERSDQDNPELNSKSPNNSAVITEQPAAYRTEELELRIKHLEETLQDQKYQNVSNQMQEVESTNAQRKKTPLEENTISNSTDSKVAHEEFTYYINPGSFSFVVGNGKDMIYNMITSDYYEGWINGESFSIRNGVVDFKSTSKNIDQEKQLILSVLQKGLDGLIDFQELGEGVVGSKEQLFRRENKFIDTYTKSSTFIIKTNSSRISFKRITSDYYEGSLDERNFAIRNGVVDFQSSFYGTDEEKQFILSSIQQGWKGVKARFHYLQKVDEKMVTNKQQRIGSENDESPSFTIYNNGAKINFKSFTSDYYEGSLDGRKFSIRNGVVDFEPGFYGTDQEKQFILTNLQQGREGMKMGILGLQAGMNALNIAGLGNVIPSMPPSTAINQIQSITPNPSINQCNNAIDNLLSALFPNASPPNNYREPIKTKNITVSLPPQAEPEKFQANELIYEDRKSYEKLDELELEPVLPDNRYIISMDESSAQNNVYYFHLAKPERRFKKTLNPREQLAIASLNRFVLFEMRSLLVHNELRALHGVPPLVNSDFICKMAREWAEHLALTDGFYHSSNKEYGENLYVAERQSVSANTAVSAWYDEIKLYDYNNPGFSKETGHFTQLVWKDTREVGTGIAQLGNKIWVCCNYYPPGNYIGKFNDTYVPRPITNC